MPNADLSDREPWPDARRWRTPHRWRRRDWSATKSGPEAPAQSAPPVGGREDGTLEGPVRPIRYEPRVQPREAIRLRKRHSIAALARTRCARVVSPPGKPA